MIEIIHQIIAYTVVFCLARIGDKLKDINETLKNKKP